MHGTNQIMIVNLNSVMESEINWTGFFFNSFLRKFIFKFFFFFAIFEITVKDVNNNNVFKETKKSLCLKIFHNVPIETNYLPAPLVTVKTYKVCIKHLNDGLHTKVCKA